LGDFLSQTHLVTLVLASPVSKMAKSDGTSQSMQKLLCRGQGDQIGRRIFAILGHCLLLVDTKFFFENYSSSANFWATFSVIQFVCYI
jgi:hypothetical protein